MQEPFAAETPRAAAVAGVHPMAMPRLFTFRRCPYAMRARMALLVAGIRFSAFEIELRNKPADLRAVSPKATVPVLVLADGRVLEQSLDIMEWALAGHASPYGWQAMLEPSARALVDLNDGDFKFHLDRYKYPQRYPGEGGAQSHRAAASQLLHHLDRRLAGQTGLAGALPGAIDLAVFPFVRQFAAVDPAWFQEQDWPDVHRWLQNWLGSTLFARAMAKIAAQVWVPFPQD